MWNEIIIPRNWKAISDPENEDVWRRFTLIFGFRHGVDSASWPGIVLPRDAEVHDASGLFEVYDTDRRAFGGCERALERWVDVAMDAVAPGERVLALSLNHAGYEFRPRPTPDADGATAPLWPVWVSPVGEYTCFITPDFTHGVFGHPWMRTICIFGERLVRHYRVCPIPFPPTR